MRLAVGAVVVALVAALWCALVQPSYSSFSATTSNNGDALGAVNLSLFAPATASASRIDATTCRVTWTASATPNPPSGLTYDVQDGSGTTLASAVAGTTTVVTIGSASVTPVVKARVGTWLGASGTTSGTPCAPVPDAPTGLTVSPADSLLVASWTAPGGNGSSVTGYTVSATPVGGGSTVTCIPSPATSTSCAVTGLTNGTQYSVTVVATNANGNGPASSAVLGTPVAGFALDGMTSGSMGAWSVRRLRAAYAGAALKVRRASDNATSTIGFTGGGDLDTTTLATFCAATSCYVTTWYDQSGRGYDLVQATAAAQPRIVNAGTVDMAGGRPTLVFSGAQLLATGASAVALGTSSLTGNAVGDVSSGSGWSSRFLTLTASGQANDWDNATSAALIQVNPTGSVFSGRVSVLGSVNATTTTLGGYTDVFDGSSDTLYAGTTAGTAAASSGSFGPLGAFAVGANTFADTPSVLTGVVSEATAFPVALGATERATLAGSQATYFLLPGSPTGVGATQGDTVSTVTWSAPSRSGASAVTGYTVTATPSDSSLPTRTCTATAPATTCALSGLTDGASYTVTVVATNGTGSSAPSAATTLVPRPALLTSVDSQLWLDGSDPDGDGTSEGTGEQCDTAVSCTTASNVLTRWKDKSGRGHNAVQATGTMAGTFVPATGAVSFNANGYYQASSIAVGPDVTAFVVGASAAASWNTWGWLLGSREPDGFMVHPNSGGTSSQGIAMYGTGTNNQAVNTAAASPSGALTALHLYDAQVAGTTTISGVMGIDGLDGVVGTAAATGSQIRAASTVTVTLGADSYDLVGRRGSGSYREVVVLDRALTYAERRTVQEYLARRWGMTLAPGIPGTPTAAPGNASATVSWSAPSWNGGSAILDSTVTASPGGQQCTATAPSTSCTVTGLTVGSSYTFTVTARNAIGSGYASAASSSVTVPGTPVAPQNLVVTIGDAQLPVSWSAPASGGPYTGYTVTGTPTDGTLSTVQCTTTSTYACTLTGVTDGASYTVAVTATNAAGTGPAASTAAVPVPSILSGANTRLWLDAQWSASLTTSCGGSTTVGTGSSVACWKDRSSDGWNAAAGNAAVLTANAINGHQALRFVKATPTYYTVTGSGINGVGGADRSIFAVATPRTAYGTTGTNNGATIAAWQGWNGGLIPKANSGTTTIDTMQADAYNSATTSMYAFGPSSGTVLAADVLSTSGSTLTNSLALNGAGALTSASTTGSWYTYSSGLWIGALSATASASYAYPMDGDIGEVIVLDKAVTAAQRRTIEEYLARRWGLTIAPQAPTGASATPGTGTAAVSWTAPAWNGGSAVTGYTVTAAPGGATCTTTSATSCTVSGLTHGTSYTFTVTATNSAGTGPASSASSAVTP